MSEGPLPVRVGIRIPACDRLDRVADAARFAEQAGFQSVWVPDSQLLWRDTYMALAFAAAHTKRISLGTAVTNVVTRHVAVVASATRTLQELAPGRVVLGLGAGWSAADSIGLRPSPHQALVEAIAVLRALFGGEKVSFGEATAQLRDPQGHCPLYLGAAGAANLTLAGGAADGVILTLALPSRLMSQKLGAVWAGATAVGRSQDDLDIVAWVPAHLTEDIERDLRLVKPTVAIGIKNTPRAELTAAGIDFELPDHVEGMHDDFTHPADWALAVEACDRVVPDSVARRFAEQFCLFGGGPEVRQRLGELRNAGVTSVVLTPLAGDSNYELPYELMESISEALSLRALPCHQPT